MATIKRVSPYSDDEMNLPVEDVDAALPFYKGTMGFEIVSRSKTPCKKVILRRGHIKIGLAENGGDPSQEGCFFEVDSVEEIFNEFKSNGLTQDQPNYRIDRYGDTAYKVFFVIAPDGLCYCTGEIQKS